MKVLFIGHYRERSGWGNAGQNYIRALDAAGVEVVPRPVLLQGDADLHPRVKELEKNSDKDCTHCIQYVLPHYMTFSSSFKKNVGLFFKETIGTNHIVWKNHLDLMDELWVPNKQMCYEFRNAKLAPVPFDIDIYEKNIEPLDIPSVAGDFVFYTIGEHNYRKHLSEIIKAFHLAFLPSEPVSLLIKVNGGNPHFLAKDVQTMCSKIKNGLKLYLDEKFYKNESIITQYISNDDMLGLHKTGNCFVNASFGESFCIPAFDAMCMGNFVISSNEGGPKDFLDRYNNKYLVEGIYEPCANMQETFFELASGRESWFNISTEDLVFAMKNAYISNMKPNQKSFIKDYSLEVVGKKMEDLLCHE